MRAMVIDRYGPPEVFRENSVRIIPLKEQDVLIRNCATSVNPVDWKVREGYLKERLRLQFPAILGWDSAGIIEKTGDKVTHFKPGDKVFSRPDIARPGTYAEYVVVDESLVAFKPEPLTFLEAASVPLAGLTAWEALKGRSSIGAGQKVLIHGGAGGVGGYAIQLAKAAGCYVITTARALNEEYVRSLGADEVIDYESQDFSSRVHDCDIVLDTVGGKVQDKSFGVLKQGGILVSITEMPDQNKAKNHGVEATWFFLEPDGQKLASLGHLFAEGKIRPTVEHIFSLANIAEAHRMSQQGHVRGKIGIVIDPKEAYQK